MKRTAVLLIGLASSLFLPSCIKELSNTESRQLFIQIVYENPNLSFDTLKTYFNEDRKVIKKSYSINDSAMRILYTAEFEMISDSLLNLKMQTETFDKLNSFLKKDKSEHLYNINKMGMIVSKNQQMGNTIQYFADGTLKYTPRTSIYTWSFKFNNNNLDSIIQLYQGKYFEPNILHLYKYSELLNLQDINQIDIPDDVVSVLNCPVILVKDFLGKPNKNLISQYTIRYSSGAKPHYDKVYHFEYESDNNGYIKMITLKDSDGKIIKREYYSYSSGWLPYNP